MYLKLFHILKEKKNQEFPILLLKYFIFHLKILFEIFFDCLNKEYITAVSF